MLLFFIIPNSAQAATTWDEFVNDLATDDAVIELENDITGSSNIVITNDKTINLNGYSISTSGTITIDGADVSINEGKITSTAGNTLSIINGGVVNLNSSTIKHNSLLDLSKIQVVFSRSGDLSGYLVLISGKFPTIST